MRRSAAIVLVLLGVVACDPEDEQEPSIADQFHDEPMNNPSSIAHRSEIGGANTTTWIWWFHVMNNHHIDSPAKAAFWPAGGYRNYRPPYPTPGNISPPGPPKPPFSGRSNYAARSTFAPTPAAARSYARAPASPVPGPGPASTSARGGFGTTSASSAGG